MDKTKKAHYEYSNFDSTIWDREIRDVDEMPYTVLNEKETPLSIVNKKFNKKNKAMLWHVSLVMHL